MNDAAMIRALMAGLIRKAPGQEAAAALISAAVGHDVSKGTISKRQAGHLEWPLVEIMALEDAIGEAPVRRWLAQTLPEAPALDLLAEVAVSSREHGEAMSAVIGYAAGHVDRSTARKEVTESLAVMQRMSARLEGEE